MGAEFGATATPEGERGAQQRSVLWTHIQMFQTLAETSVCGLKSILLLIITSLLCSCHKRIKLLGLYLSLTTICFIVAFND